MPQFGPIFQVDAATRPAAGEPFALRHALGRHELFARPRLSQLAARMPASDYFVSYPARNAKTPFYDSLPEGVAAGEVVDGIERGIHKLLLKRPENHDASFRALLDECLSEAIDLVEVRRRDIIRANSFIFLTGRDAITPLHFDPEYGFFMQIEGRKTYNLWSPHEVDDDDLERHYAHRAIDVGKVSVDDPNAPSLVVALEPGVGLHQPPEAPHWVQTHNEVSVSYSIAFETEASRARGRTFAFNRLARKLGGKPGRPGESAIADRVKSTSMRVLAPAIEAARKLGR